MEPEARLAWNAVMLQRLYDGSDIPTRRILEHLHCHADEWETRGSLGEFVRLSDRRLATAIDELERRCRVRFRRDLPFDRVTTRSGERYRMASALADLVYEVI